MTLRSRRRGKGKAAARKLQHQKHAKFSSLDNTQPTRLPRLIGLERRCRRFSKKSYETPYNEFATSAVNVGWPHTHAGILPRACEGAKSWHYEVVSGSLAN